MLWPDRLKQKQNMGGAADPSQSHATGPQHTPQVVLSPPVPHPLAPALVPRYS